MKYGLRASSPSPEALVAVPLSHWRYFTRGYNQSQLIAKELSNQLSIPDLSYCVGKGHSWRPQHKKERASRLAAELNFSCRSLPQALTHIALIDDVVTTGSTLNALAACIKQTHPHIKIDAWVLAVTPDRA